MILSRLSIVNFKNIAQADLEFSSGLNCFLGNNGMGKTNLLDALYYLSFCKSYTRNPDSQNIRHGEDFFVVQGYYERNGNEEELYCGIKRRQKKAFKRNKKEYDRLSDHIGFAPLVMAAPSDNELILGGSEERRKFIDLVISQFDKQYLSTLIRYNKALEQRNALLRQECSEEMLYDIWEEQMDSTAAQIHNSRDRFLQSFIPVFRRFYNEISSQNESADLFTYSSIETIDFGKRFPGSIFGRKQHLFLRYRPFDTHLLIVENKRCLGLRSIHIVDLVNKCRRIAQNKESMSKSPRDKKLTCILGRQFHGDVFSECRRRFSQIDGYIEYTSLENSYQFCLGEFAFLKMQSP